MDKSDVALLLSAVSAVTAVGSLIYARRIALNDSARMKRKQLVFETSSTPCKEYPDWHSVTVIIVSANFTARMRFSGRESPVYA